MKSYKILIFAILFISSKVFAGTQSLFEIRGIVVDSIGDPIDCAVVSLLDAERQSVLSQTITSDDGQYALKGAGDVLMFVSSLGYQSWISDLVSLSSDINYPPVILREKDIALTEVIVIGNRNAPTIKMEGGTMIFSPANSATVAGGNALDVVKKTPGVIVDADNNISVGGRQNVIVTINGKSTYLQPSEVVSYMKTIPAGQIKSIEVSHSPSAKYDAQGSGGIINIVTTHRHIDGFFAEVGSGVSYWKHLRNNTQLELSYNTDRMRLWCSYNHAFGHIGMDYGMERTIGETFCFSSTDDVDKRKTLAGNIGLEYFITPHHVIGARTDINVLSGPGLTTTTTEIREASTMDLLQTLYAQNDYFRQRANRYGGNIYFRATPREGVSYDVDANYARFDGGSGNMQPNSYVAPNGSPVANYLYKSVNSRDINIAALSYDQQHPLWDGTLKAGVKYSMVDADNDFRFYDMTSGSEILDTSQSNNFDYREHIGAAYMLYSRSLSESLQIEAGVRGEYTNSCGRLRSVGIGNGSSNTGSYFNFFPSLSLSWQMKPDHVLSFNYSSRINRPAYQDLNPFEYLLDELSSWKGNPFLKPQKSHSFASTYSHARTAVTLSYTYIHDYSAQITDTLGMSKVVMTPQNIGRQHLVSLGLYQGMRISHWLDADLNVTGYYKKNDIAFDDYRRLQLDGLAGIASIQCNFHLPWRINMELSGQYSTRHIGASNEHVRSSGSVDLGVARAFLDGNLRVNFALTDIFHTSRWDNYSDFYGLKIDNWGNYESRQIKLNITYRIGKDKPSAHSSDFDEINRL